jgi:hypothetical protein
MLQLKNGIGLHATTALTIYKVQVTAFYDDLRAFILKIVESYLKGTRPHWRLIARLCSKYNFVSYDVINIVSYPNYAYMSMLYEPYTQIETKKLPVKTWGTSEDMLMLQAIHALMEALWGSRIFLELHQVQIYIGSLPPLVL